MNSLQAISFLENINPKTKREILKKMCFVTKHTTVYFHNGIWQSDQKYYMSDSSEDEKNRSIINDMINFFEIEIEVDKDMRYLEMYTNKTFPACTCKINSNSPEYKDIFIREKWNEKQVIDHLNGVNSRFNQDYCGEYHAGDIGVYKNIEVQKWI